jgi:hypothetical protein
VQVLYFINDLDRLDPKPTGWPANVTVLAPQRVDKSARFFGALRWPWWPNFVAARKWAARRLMRTLLSDPSIDIIYADFAQGLAAVPIKALPRVIFRQHDIVSNLFARHAAQTHGLRRNAYGLEAARTRLWENIVWSRVAQMRTLTEEDAQAVTRRQPAAEVKAEVVRGTVTVANTLRSPDSIIAGRIGYWGNMARQENIDAVQHMVNVLLPRIRQVHPHAHLWIIGAHPSAEVQALSSEYVHVTGFLEDPTAAFATLDLAAAPLRLGSGVKIKVFETIDADIPTVVSPVGGEGIEDHPNLYRAATDDAFVQQVVALIHPLTRAVSQTGTAKPATHSTDAAPAANPAPP